MELPINLIANILVRLPLKNIVILRCVCRSWYTLISDPYFTSNYVKNSPPTTHFLAQDHHGRNSFLLHEVTASGESTQTTIKPKLPEVVDTDLVCRVTLIVGSCYGSLFLFHCICYRFLNLDKIYSCNPVLESHIQVAESKIEFSPLVVLNYNAGYVPCNNTYKLLRLVYRMGEGGKVGEVEEAKVFTIGMDDVWRVVVEDPLCFWDYYMLKEVICFNGAYHWVDYRPNKDQDLDWISTFDLSEEKSGAGIPKPPGLSRFSRLTTSLMVFNDCLSVADCLDDSGMVIWIMREYGVMGSWSRDVVLRLMWVHYPPTFCRESILPIAVFKNGNILFAEKCWGDLLFFYSREKNRWTDLYADHGISHAVHVNTYAPSKVLFTHGGNDQIVARMKRAISGGQESKNT